MAKIILSAAIILSLCVTLMSCKKQFYLNTKLTDKLVVFGEITAGDSLSISVGKSLLVGSGSPISFEKVNNALVTIAQQNAASWQLLLDNSPAYINNPTAVYSNSKTVQFNTSYALNAKHPLLGTVKARTSIPGPFHVSNVITNEDDVNGEDVFIFTFSIDDPAGEKNYYIFEAVKQLLKVSRYFYWQGVRYNLDTQQGQELYDQVEDEPEVDLLIDTIPTNNYIRLNLYTKDKKSDNNDFSSLDSSFRRIFLTDSGFNGQTYTSQFAVSMKYFQAVNRQDVGRVLIQVKSVAKELYDYLSDYEKYKSDLGSVPTGQLISPTGNIQNGLGVFGGVSKKEWKYYFDDLE